MSEHLLAPQIDRYRRRLLSPMELQAIDEHIGGCQSCRALLNEQLGDLDELEAALHADWTDLLAGVGAPTKHLSYEEVAAYAYGEFPSPERQRHLHDCPECEERLANLRSFRDEAERVPLSDAEGFPPPVPFWDRISKLLPLPLVPTAALAALLIAAAGWFTLTSREGRPLAIALNDGGGRVGLNANGEVVAPTELPASYREVMERALTRPQLRFPPALANLIGDAGQLRGGLSNAGLPFALTSPVATMVKTDQPTLRWESFPGANRYIVTISERENVIATSPPLTGTQWTVPEPLPRNRPMTWQVTALTDGEKVSSPVPPAAPARFQVCDQNKAQELAAAREKYGGIHLLLGNLYAEAGLLDEAAREFQSLLDANPDSATARKLLDEVHALRRGN